MIRPLCAPVEIYPDESLLSAIARSAEINVVPAISTLLKHADVEAGRAAFIPFTQFAASTDIGRLIGASPTEVVRRMLPRTENTDRKSIDWFGTPLDRRFIEANLRRLSFSALNKEPYARAIWMIRPLPYCPESFDLLQSNCPSCKKVLGWTRSLGIAICEHCEQPLTARSKKLPSVRRHEYQNIAALVDMDSNRRKATAALLPLPFRDWDHGSIFEAVIDLGALAQHSGDSNSRDLWLPLAKGDFSSVGEGGLFQGWSLINGWPTAVDGLLRDIVNSRRCFGKLKEVLGPIGRFCHPKSKTPLRPLIEERLSVVLRELDMPFKVFAGSGALHTERMNSIAMWEAERDLSIGARSLRRLAEAGDCLLEKSSGPTGLRLFDRTKLETAVSLARSGVSAFKFSEETGIPAYVVGTLIQHGIVDQILDPNVKVLSRRPLLTPVSVASLYEAFDKLSPPMSSHNMTSLSEELARDLSPYVWSEALMAIKSGELPASLAVEGEQWSKRLLVHSEMLHDHLVDARAIPLPDSFVPACTAAPIVGVNDAVLGQAVNAGLLQKHEEGFLLKDLDAFRTAYIFPSEISKWFDGSGWRFARTMEECGISPVATLHKINIWQRSDVAQVFGSQAKWNMRTFESATSE